MGLDISACKNAALLAFDNIVDDEPVDAHGETINYDARIFANPDFPGREAGLINRGFYSGDYSDGAEGCWGYGSYNGLRNELAKLAGYALGKAKSYGHEFDSYCVECWNGVQGPFAELINFSDCEGFIGPVVSKKLAADFAQFQDKADAHESERFRDFYATMRAAFDVAAQDGFVHFH